MRDARYSRHVAVAEFGAIGHAAVRAGVARVELHDDAAAVAAMFLAAGGIGELALTGDADRDAQVAARARDTRIAPSAAPTLAIPDTGDWWPHAAGDDTARALYRGGVAAASWMLDARERFRAVVAQICAHALAAFPRECCGYVAGDDVVRCENVAAEADAYAFADADLVTFVRTLDSPRPARVVYHSHPNGTAYLSPRDRAVAATPAGPIYPVVHLVVGIAASGPREAALFAWDAAAGDFAEVARFALPC